MKQLLQIKEEKENDYNCHRDAAANCVLLVSSPHIHTPFQQQTPCQKIWNSSLNRLLSGYVVSHSHSVDLLAAWTKAFLLPALLLGNASNMFSFIVVAAVSSCTELQDDTAAKTTGFSGFRSVSVHLGLHREGKNTGHLTWGKRDLQFFPTYAA